MCVKEIHRLGPMVLQIYNPSKKPVTETRQPATATDFDKIITLTSISGDNLSTSYHKQLLQVKIFLKTYHYVNPDPAQRFFTCKYASM